MKAISRIIVLIFLSLLVFNACKSSDPLAKQKIIENIDSKMAKQEYTFHGRMANPMSGRSISLTSSYTLVVKKDTIIAHLPYFGRAYSAPSPSNEGGIKFTSTDFNYAVSEKRKGVYTVAITINDNNNNYKLSLLVGETGNTTLHVNQRNKQSISFNGTLD